MAEQSAARRTRDEVVVIILRCLKQSDETKTNVMHEARTSPAMMNTIYEPYLFENGLVQLVNNCWSITRKGTQYLALEEKKIAVLQKKEDAQ